MNQPGMDAINNQEDEDGYVLYPSCAINEKKVDGERFQTPLLAGESYAPPENERLIHGFVLAPDAPIKE